MKNNKISFQNYLNELKKIVAEGLIESKKIKEKLVKIE